MPPCIKRGGRGNGRQGPHDGLFHDWLPVGIFLGAAISPATRARAAIDSPAATSLPVSLQRGRGVRGQGKGGTFEQAGNGNSTFTKTVDGSAKVHITSMV